MKPDWRGTAIILAFLLLAGATLREAEPSLMAGRAAWITGTGLLLGFLTEARSRDPRQMFRVDWAALAAAYYLTLAEFLVPQPMFRGEVDPPSTAAALRLVLSGLAALAIGRHLVPPAAAPARTVDLSRRELLILLACCFALGNLHMFASVGFNPLALFRELFGPRFSQPWARERLGDHRALVSELQLLNYLVPPVTAFLLVHGVQKHWARVGIASPLAFLLFAAFCSGTRYVLAIHLATFASALAWSLPRLPLRRALPLFGIPFAALLVFTVAAVQFRHEGLARQAHGQPKRFIIDNNLRTIARLTGTFPGKHPYLGVEVPYHILVRPVPRALFPAKPEKLSLSMEDVIGIPGTSIASTFVGEGFLMAGLAGTVAFGLGLGALCAWWNRIAVPGGSAFAIILYCSGFHWTLLSVRSPIWLSIGFLPCLAFIAAACGAFPVARRLLTKQGEADHGSPRL